MKSFGNMGAALLASLGVSMASVYPSNAPLVSRKRKKRTTKQNTSIAQLNRWTGKPHENKREISRRVKQMERISV
jgi:hypothetical protein